jgi:hypothetical protein
MPERSGFPHGDFFKVPNAIFGSRGKPGWIGRIGIGGLAVYALVLRRYHHARGGSIYESHAAMAGVLAISKTTLEKHLSRLQSFGLIDRRVAGRRKHPTFQYVPVIPVPEVAGEESDESNRPTTGPRTDRIDQLVKKNRPVDEGVPTMDVIKIQVIKPRSAPPNRLFNRLNKNMCVEAQVEEIVANVDSVPLPTQVQVAWKYWCSLWEEKYSRPYYLAQAKENTQAIRKDKKNLRDKIDVVGFEEVIARMRRCIEVCDTTFPCVVNGTWQRPITFNDFVGNHFFDRWIPLRREPMESAPRTLEEKVQAAMDKRQRAICQKSGEDSSTG